MMSPEKRASLNQGKASLFAAVVTRMIRAKASGEVNASFSTFDAYCDRNRLPMKPRPAELYSPSEGLVP